MDGKNWIIYEQNGKEHVSRLAFNNMTSLGLPCIYLYLRTVVWPLGPFTPAMQIFSCSLLT